MNRVRVKGSRGFTLIEVLIAILVVALGMGALLTTLSSSANAIARMRDKSFAQWIALNQISNLHLSGSQPAVGTTYGVEDFAGSQWRWQQLITDPGVAGIVRVEVRVARLSSGDADQAPELGDALMAAVGSAFGFMSSSVARPSGLTPDWSFAAAQSANGPGAGGGGGEDGGAGGGGRGGGNPGAPQP